MKGARPHGVAAFAHRMHVSGIPYVVNIFSNPKPPLSQNGCGAATLSQKAGWVTTKMFNDWCR